MNKTKQQRRLTKMSGRSYSSTHRYGLRRRTKDGSVLAPRSVRSKFYYIPSANDIDKVKLILKHVFGINTKSITQEELKLVNDFCNAS